MSSPIAPPQRLARRSTSALVAGLTTSALALAGVAAVAPTASAATLRAAVVAPDDWSVTRVAGVAGSYQLAASETSGDILVTSTVGQGTYNAASGAAIATLARLDGQTLELEQAANLPTLPTTTEGVKRLLGTHGIDVDDAHGNVWVTNTRNNQVSVFKQSDLSLVHTTYNFADTANVAQTEVNHPREVAIDETRNLAFVSSANRGNTADGLVSVYSTVNYAKITDITIPARADYPAAGASAAAVTMGFALDEAAGKVYVNDFKADRYYTIDATTYAVTAHDVPTTGLEPEGDETTVAAGRLQPSSLSIDVDRKLLFSANQAGSEGTGSVQAFDLDTHEVVWERTVGKRALGVAADTVRGLVYVADFTNGEVNILDALTGTTLETVTEIPGRANHIIVAGGSAYVVDKSGSFTAQEVSYGITQDGTPTSATTNVDGLTKITPVGQPTARIATTGDLRPGQVVTVEGTGFTPGQRLAVKMDNDDYGQIAADEDENIAEATRERIEVRADGTFRTTLQLPNVAPGTGTPVPAGAHTLHFLDDQPVTNPVAKFRTVAAPKLTAAATIVGAEKITVTGTGFAGAGAASGAYVSFGEKSIWTVGKPYVSAGWIKTAWVRANQITDGTFTVDLDISKATLDPSKEYVLTASAAHLLSQSDRTLDVSVAQPVSLPQATVEVVGSAKVGGTITLNGTGFVTKDGKAGSVVAIRLGQDATGTPGGGFFNLPDDGGNIWATVTAAADGTFSQTIALPDGTTTGAAGSVPALVGPKEISLRLLSGSLLEGDTARSILVPLQVAAADVVPTPTPTTKPTTQPTTTPTTQPTATPTTKPTTLKATTKARVTGTARVGKRLSAVRPTYNVKGVKTTFQWLRDGKVVKGATKPTYTLTSADRGHRVSVRTTGTLSTQKVTSTSARTAKVAAGKLTVTKKAKVSGKAKVGTKLRATAPKLSVSKAKVSYQWLRNGKAVKGATKSAYTVKAKDRGARISVRVTVKKAGYTTITTTSAKTAKIK